MAATLRARSEIPAEETWDVASIFAGDGEWDRRTEYVMSSMNVKTLSGLGELRRSGMGDITALQGLAPL